MENYKVLFLITLSLLIISTTGVGYYTERTIKGLESDFNLQLEQNKQQYDTKLDTLQKQVDGKITTLSKDVDTKTSNVKTELTTKIDTTQQVLKNDITGLNTQLTQAKQESDEKIKGLQEDLLDINIESQDFTAIISSVTKAAVSIKTENSVGSGVIVDTRGYLVTNYHVVQGKNTLNAMLIDGSTRTARLAGYDANADVAVLKIEGTYSKLDFANSDDVVIGEKVIAMGSPGGLDFTVTEGIISAIRMNNGIKYLQTDVPINPGNSGGPLVNKAGKIIGINTMKISGFEGLGFAISSNNVKIISDELIRRDAG
ncbi:MAG: trypsin-like peptidase domain-containing protein [Nanoarchaeota archaeon]